MLHPWHHKESHECLGPLPTHSVDYAVVILDGVERRNCRVIPTVVEDQFPPARLKCGEVWLGSIQDLGCFFLCCPHDLIDVRVPIVPIVLLIDHIGKVSATKGE